jgi:uncharacterized protein YbbK (DUF523 family)
LQRVLVSACLLGEPVRYDGRAAATAHPILDRWIAEGRVVPFCPEVAGGLTVPRTPAERVGRRVVTAAGEDVTGAFGGGARQALDAALGCGAALAILKDGSPSCGSTWVYDGTFSGTRRPGAGVTADLLRRHGIAVFDESRIEEADSFLRTLDTLNSTQLPAPRERLS